MSRGRGDPVKVVIINTEYIETDAINFKSVVQSLTGKDSSLDDRRKNLLKLSSESGGGDDGLDKSKVLNKGMSFRDLDRLLMELPSMDDIYRFCAD